MAITDKKSEVRFIALAQALDVERAQKEPVFAEKHVDDSRRRHLPGRLPTGPFRGTARSARDEALAPGKYEWKVVLRDEFTGRIGSYKTEVVLPDLSTGEQSSSLLLTGCYAQVPRLSHEETG